MNDPVFASEETSALRSLRAAALAVLSTIVALLLVPGFATVSSTLRGAIMVLLHAGHMPYEIGTPMAAAVVLVPFVAAAAGIFLAAWRLKMNSWSHIAVGCLAAAAALGYLAADDSTLRHPLTLDQLSPRHPGDGDSFKVLMRYGMHEPLGMSFKAPAFKEPYPDWRKSEVILARRSEIEAHWSELGPERAWWTELNAFDRIGDLTEAGGDSIPFIVLRTISQHGLAIARLQAMDGHGDEAVRTLLPFIQVGQKLQASSRTFVRAMIGTVTERTSLEAADFVLVTAPVSPAVRARLALTVQGIDPDAGAHRLEAFTYAYAVSSWSPKVGDLLGAHGNGNERPWMRRLLNAASPFVYNPKATLNLYGDLSADLQDIAGRRQLAELGPRVQRFLGEDTRPRFKNMLGTLYLREVIPAYSKVTENFWKAEDVRAALLARIKAL